MEGGGGGIALSRISHPFETWLPVYACRGVSSDGGGGGGFAAGRMMYGISVFYLTFTIHLYTTVIVLIDIMHYIYAVRTPKADQPFG